MAVILNQCVRIDWIAHSIQHLFRAVLVDMNSFNLFFCFCFFIMDIVLKQPPMTYYYIHKLEYHNPHQGSFSLQAMAINPAAPKWSMRREYRLCGCPALNGTYTSHPSPRTQGFSQRWSRQTRRTGSIKNIRKLYFPETTGQLQLWIHINYDSMH